VKKLILSPFETSLGNFGKRLKDQKQQRLKRGKTGRKKGKGGGDGNNVLCMCPGNCSKHFI
jgi:hypothetical protein